MSENYTYAPVERVVMTTAEFAALRETAANLEAALLANQEEQAQLRAERDELAAVLAYIDAHTPRADSTCNEPGITLSEAARREMREVGA